MDYMNKILRGDSLKILKTMPDGIVNTCITSPPYFGLRDYGVDGQIGLEETPEQYVRKLVLIFREVKRVLRDDGTLWLNLGDSYAGSGKGRNTDGTVHVSSLMAKQGTSAGTIMGDVPSGVIPNGLKPKDLIGIPWRVAFALQADGWYLRQDIIWHKPNPMPESVKDRCTKSHEYIFLLSKSKKYYFDNEAIKEETFREGGKPRIFGAKKQEGTMRNDVGAEFIDDGKRNKRSVWTVTTKPFKGAHFATFPEDLITPCVLAGCPENGIVLDPFMGSGTTALVAKKNNRNYVGCELNKDYIELAIKRIYNPITVYEEDEDSDILETPLFFNL
jgi:DNA modification methylase